MMLFTQEVGVWGWSLYIYAKIIQARSTLSSWGALSPSLSNASLLSQHSSLTFLCTPLSPIPDGSWEWHLGQHRDTLLCSNRPLLSSIYHHPIFLCSRHFTNMTITLSFIESSLFSLKLAILSSRETV